MGSTFRGRWILNFVARADGEYLQGTVGGLPANGIVHVMVAEDQYDAGRAVIERWNAGQPTEPTPAPQRAPARWLYVVAGLVMGVIACFAYLRSPVNRGGVDHNGDGILDET